MYVMKVSDPLGHQLPLNRRERAYSPSSLAPSYKQTLTQYRSDSQAAIALLGQPRVLRYGPAAREKILLFQATRSPGATIVYIHGGYWQELSAKDSLFSAPGLNAHGLDYAAVGYSLAPNVPLEYIVDQVAQALLTLRTWYAARGQVPKIILVGSSAGAHLAAMLLCRIWPDSSPFQGALLVSGIYDLQPLVGTYINQPLHLTPHQSAQLSPLHLPIHNPVPVAIAWGEMETTVFKYQSLALAERLTHYMPVTAVRSCSGRNHFDIVFDIAIPQTTLNQCLKTLLTPEKL
ncbi:alpha/beta hydrolase [Halomonas sp. AOP12-C2-37]|uniref:Alpha/beta hydrolase n=2 Tax=Halomonas TaxID=2745 RepID=A0A1R4HYJ7_9GAMM|nr:alpha/beta hydrolase [Halomonas citrativorans]SJN12414.1 putative esterase [Halomonas citrativorans]